MPDNNDVAVTEGDLSAPLADSDGAEKPAAEKPAAASKKASAPKRAASKAAAATASVAAKPAAAKPAAAKRAAAKPSTVRPAAGKATNAKAGARQGAPGAATHERVVVDRRLEAIAERLRKLNERIIDAGREAGEATLSSYEKALKTIVTGIEKAPGSNEIEWLAQVATAQAKFIRDLTDTWTKAARGRIK